MRRGVFVLDSDIGVFGLRTELAPAPLCIDVTGVWTSGMPQPDTTSPPRRALGLGVRPRVFMGLGIRPRSVYGFLER